MSLQITHHSNFQTESVGFSNLRKNKNGGKAVYLNISDRKLYIQLPKLRSPYGLSTYTDEGTGRTSYSLDLSFDTDNEEAMAFREKMIKLDDLVINTVVENSKEWLGKKFNEAVCREALYKPIVRPGKEQYADTMKLKILTNTSGGFVPEAYNSKRENVPLDTIEKGQKVTCIVDVVQIWFIDNKFGVTARLQQALLEPSAKLPAFAFLGAQSSDKDAEEEFIDEDETYEE